MNNVYVSAEPVNITLAPQHNDPPRVSKTENIDGKSCLPNFVVRSLILTQAIRCKPD